MFPATKKRKKKDARGICSVHLVENKKEKKNTIEYEWLTTIIRTNSNSRYFLVFLEE